MPAPHSLSLSRFVSRYVLGAALPIGTLTALPALLSEMAPASSGQVRPMPRVESYTGQVEHAHLMGMHMHGADVHCMQMASIKS